jgi:phosphomannomutase
VIDYENQTRILADGMRSSLKLPSSNVIGFELKGHHRVMLRPSGTEPKMKIYIDICEPLSSEGSLPHAKTAASQKAHQVLNWTLDYLKTH